MANKKGGKAIKQAYQTKVNKKKGKKEEEPKRTRPKNEHRASVSAMKSARKSISPVTNAVQYIGKKHVQDVVKTATSATKRAETTAGHGNKGKSGAIHPTSRNGGRTNPTQKKREELYSAQKQSQQKKEEQVKKSGYSDTVRKMEATSKAIGKSAKKDLNEGAKAFSGEEKEFKIPIYSQYAESKAKKATKGTVKKAKTDAGEEFDKIAEENGLSENDMLENGMTVSEYREKIVNKAGKQAKKTRNQIIEDSGKISLSGKDIYKGSVKLANEMVDYLVPYGGSAKGAIKSAEGILKASKAAKAGKILTETGEKGAKALTKDGKKLVKEYANTIARGGDKKTAFNELMKKVSKSDLKQNVKKELLANAMQDASIGTGIDLVKGIQDGYTGKDLGKYMGENALMNMAIGVPVSALAGRTGKAGKQLLREDAVKGLNDSLKMTEDEGRELIKLTRKSEKVNLSEGESARMTDLQNKAITSYNLNKKGDLVESGMENISNIMSPSELKQHAYLRAKEANGTLKPKEQGALDLLNKKADMAVSVLNVKVGSAVKSAKNNIATPSGKNIKDLKDGIKFYDRMGMTGESKKAKALLEKATQKYEKTLSDIATASKKISEDIGRNVVVEDEASIVNSLAKTGRSVEDPSLLGGFAELDDAGKIVAIHVNKDSEHALQFSLGHEITHAFESLGDQYESFKTALKNFAGDDWERELEWVASQYGDVAGAKYENEAVANLVGRHLFEEGSDFLDKLIEKDPSLFEKLRDFIKKLIGATADNNSELKALDKQLDDLYSTLVEKNKGENVGETAQSEMLFGAERSAKEEDPKLYEKLVDKNTGAKARLEMAKKEFGDDIEALNKERRKIFNETRWFQSFDGKWRYEIDDSNISFLKNIDLPSEINIDKSLVHVSNDGKLVVDSQKASEYSARIDDIQKQLKNTSITKKERTALEKELSQLQSKYSTFALCTEGLPLKGVIKHKSFFKMYPDAESIKVKIVDGQYADRNGFVGRYENANGERVLELTADMFDKESGWYRRYGEFGEDAAKRERYRTLVHELQHYIQEEEGLARGTSPEGYFDAYENIYPKKFDKDYEKLRKIIAERDSLEDKLYKDAGDYSGDVDHFLDKYSDFRAEDTKLDEMYAGSRTDFVKYAFEKMQRQYHAKIRKEYKQSLIDYLLKDYDAAQLAERNPRKLYETTAGEVEARMSENRMYKEDPDNPFYGEVPTTSKDRKNDYPVKDKDEEVGYDFDEVRYIERPETFGERITKPSKNVELLYGGQKSMTANAKALAEAMDLLEQGKYIMRNGGDGYKTFEEWESLKKQREMKGLSRDEIRKKTGWFQGVDGEWRYEISDFGMHTKMSIKKLVEVSKNADANKETTFMGDFVEHDDLYKAYPDAKDIPLSFINDKTVDWSGSFSPKTGGITLNVAKMFNGSMTRAEKNSELKRVISHELQHFVQNKEGFAKGGNPQEYMFTRPWVDQEQYIKDAVNVQKAMKNAEKAYENYTQGDSNVFQYYKKNLSTYVDDAVQSAKDEKEFKALLDKLIKERCSDLPIGAAVRIKQWIYSVRSMDFKKRVSLKREAFEHYRNTVGEIEARDVMDRQNLPSRGYENKDGEFIAGRDSAKPEAIEYAERLERKEALAKTRPSDFNKREAQDVRNVPKWNENSGDVMVSEDTNRHIKVSPNAGERFPNRLTNPDVELSYGARKTPKASSQKPNKDKARIKAKNRAKTEAQQRASAEKGLTEEQITLKRRLEKASATLEKQEKRVSQLETKLKYAKTEEERSIIEQQLADAKRGRTIARSNRTRLQNRFDASTKPETELPKGKSAPKKPKTKAEEIKSEAPPLEERVENAKNGYISAHEMGLHAKKLGETWSAEVKETERAFREAAKSGEFGGKLKRTISYDDAYEKALKDVEEDFGKVYDRVMAREDFDVENSITAAEKNAVLVELIKRAGNGDENAALMHLKVLDKMDKTASLSGHMLQFQSYVLRNSPEGRLRFVMREIKRLNKEYERALKGKEIELTPQQIQRILDAKDPLDVAKTMDEIGKEMWKQIPSGAFETLNQIRHFSMLFNPKTHGRNVGGNTIFKGARMVSDFIEVELARASKNRITKLSGLEKFQKEYDEVGVALKDKDLTPAERQQLRSKQAILRNRIKQAKDEIKDPMASFVSRREEKACRDILNERFDVDYVVGEKSSSRWSEGKRSAGYINERTKSKTFNKVAEIGNKLIDVNYELLDKEDKWFFRPAYRKEYIRYCKSKGFTETIDGKTFVTKQSLENMTKSERESATAWAMQKAKVATFRDDSAISKRIIAWKNATETKGGAGAPLYRAMNVAMESVLPFIKTPVNIMRRGMDYSPIGLFRGVSEAVVAKNVPEFMNGIHHLSTGLTGSGVLVLGMWAASHDWVTVEAGEESGDAFYDRDAGIQDYSLKVHVLGNDYSASLDWLAPMQFAFFQGASVYKNVVADGVHSIEDVLTAFEKTAGSTVSPLLEMSFMSSAKDTVESFVQRAYRNSDGSGGEISVLNAASRTLLGTLPTDWLSGFAPQIMNQSAGFLDDKMRDTSSTKENEIVKVWETFGRQMQNRIPIFRESLNAKVNRKGEEVSNEGVNILTKFANAFINPSTIKKINIDKYDRAVIDIYKNMDDDDPNKQKMMFNLTGNPFYDVEGKWLGRGKDDRRMTYDERSKYLAENRSAQWEKIKRMVDSVSFKSMTNGMKAEEVKDYHYISTTMADAKVYGYKYAKNKLIDEQIDTNGTQKEIWKSIKTFGGSAKDFVRSYIATEDLSARAHAGSDYHTKALAIQAMKFSGGKANGDAKRDMLGKAYDIYGDKIEPAKKFLAHFDNVEKALTEYATTRCAGVAVCKIAEVSTSKRNLSLGLANSDVKTRERDYRAMGYDWQSAQAGGGLRDYGYTYKSLDKMVSEAKLNYDDDHNNSLKKAEVVNYIESLGITNNDEKACLFEYLKTSANTKNPYGTIDDHLEWGTNPDSEGSGRGRGHGWGHGHGRGGGGSGRGKMPKTDSGAIKGKVSNPFSNTGKPSNLDDAYRKKLKKLREQAR